MTRKKLWPRKQLRAKRLASKQAPTTAMPVKSRLLLTAGELAFFRILRKAVPLGCYVSLKTRLADVIDCPASEWERPFGRRLAQKHVDFVLYNPSNGSILAIVELDDRSHDRPDRKKRDAFLDETLWLARIPLLRVRAAATYELANLTRQIAAVVLSISNATSAADRPKVFG